MLPIFAEYRIGMTDVIAWERREILQITWIFSRRLGVNEQEMYQNVKRTHPAALQLFKELYQNVKRMRRENRAEVIGPIRFALVSAHKSKWCHHIPNVRLKSSSYPGHINQKVLKQSPDVIAGVNLFHLDFCVHIAMVEEVNVRVLHLGYHQNMLTAKILYILGF